MPTGEVSPLPFRDRFHVDVQLRIFLDEDRYVADIQSEGGKIIRLKIDLTSNDVKDINTELQNAISRISANCTDYNTTINEQLRDALANLAQKGKFAFNSIFAQGSVRDIVIKALKKDATIQVASEGFFIPWEVLYTGTLDYNTKVEQFWGMKYIVSRSIIQEARPGAFASSEIKCKHPLVGLFTNNTLPYVRQVEIPHFHKLQDENKLSLTILPDLDPVKRNLGIKKFDQFISQKMQILHAACHAHAVHPPHQSYLLVNDDFPITIEDFRVRDFEVKHNPLVILNACLTGMMNPRHTSNWAAEFWKRGARGVLATEFHVPDQFAAHFIEKLYFHLLSGRTVGESLLLTRRYFWNKRRNPLGLAYALYSSPSVRIVRED